MAYVNNDKTSQVRNDLKAAFPAKAGWKFSVRKEHNSTVNVTIVKAPIDFVNVASPVRNWGQTNEIFHEGRDGNKYAQVRNAEAFTGEAAKAINKIIEIINVGNFDKSDRMTDYFHVGFYWDLSIGEFSKQVEFTGVTAAPVQEVTVEETAVELTPEEMESLDAYLASDVYTGFGSGLTNEEGDLLIDQLSAARPDRYAATVDFILNGTVTEGVTPGATVVAEAKAMIAEAEGRVAPEILESPTPKAGNIFEGAEVISRYTRAQAIEDGFLVDVSELAKEAGIVYPVAITSALNYDISTIPAGHSYQDYTGRLWDVLYMFALRARNHTGGPDFNYEIVMHTGRKARYIIKANIGPGDTAAPVITLMKPNED